MDFLCRDGAPIPSGLWDSIDSAVVSTASKILKARCFLSLGGPVGAGVQFTKIDKFNRKEEFEDWYVKTTNRQIIEIPQIYSDFWLNWRDLEADAVPNLSAAHMAAQRLAQHEDEMIFYGIPAIGLDGLLTVKGSLSVKRSDWSSGEGAFSDIAAGMTALEKNNRVGRYVLVVSPDIFIQLQRIQPGTGVLESKRIKKLLGSKIIKSTVLKNNTAFLVCAENYCMDLLIGQDMTTAYLESVDMNHHLRVMETALLRIKCPDAIVIFK